MHSLVSRGSQFRSSESAASRASGWWDVLAALLLLAALTTAAGRLVVTEWTGHLNIVWVSVLLGWMAGLALGWSVFSQRRIFAFALIYGSFGVTWLLGGKLEKGPWRERLIGLIERLVISLIRLVQQKPVEDPLLFLFCMVVLFWALSVHAGYTLVRHAHPWRVVLPSGLALLIIHSYNALLTSRVWFLAVYLFFALLLLSRLTYLRYRAIWRQDRVLVPSYVGTDIIRLTLQVTLALVLVAWIVPVVATTFSPAREAWRRVSRPWVVIRDRLSNAVAALRDQVGGVQNFYGENLSLGYGDELSDDIVLVVNVQPAPVASPRYYWRARVYNRYVGGRWSTTGVSATQIINPRDVGLNFPQMERRWTGVFTVTTAAPISTLYVPAQPLWVDQPARAELIYNPDGTADVFALYANPPVQAGGSYQVRSALSMVTVAQLRSAGTDYPDWVVDRYLQLPPEITPRVRELARRIAADLENPYDVTAAVTAYLRRRISYSRIISTQRPDYQEPLDWFLFDLQEGHCNYYASAEVILLRSLGIPARLAVGFAEGERESGENVYMTNMYNAQTWSGESQVYVVRQRHAHAWPEVYFSGVGWVEFEPTASYPPVDRPLGDDSVADGSFDSSLLDLEIAEDETLEQRLEELLIEERVSSISSPSSTANSNSFLSLWPWLLVLSVLLALIAVVWHRHYPQNRLPFPLLLREGLRRLDLQPPAILQRWIARATVSSFARAYLEINAALIRLGFHPKPADTPAERALALRGLLPDAAESVQTLLDEYQRVFYGSCLGNLYAAQEAARHVRRSSWSVAIRRFVDRE